MAARWWSRTRRSRTTPPPRRARRSRRTAARSRSATRTSPATPARSATTPPIALQYGGFARVEDSLIQGNAGGGMSVDEFGDPAIVEIVRTTIDGNSANIGGGLLLDGSRAFITDSTISNNVGSLGKAGGIFVGDAELTLTRSTISGNVGQRRHVRTRQRRRHLRRRGHQGARRAEQRARRIEHDQRQHGPGLGRRHLPRGRAAPRSHHPPAALDRHRQRRRLRRQRNRRRRRHRHADPRRLAREHDPRRQLPIRAASLPTASGRSPRAATT